MKTLGVIGGLGPAATSYFYERVIDMTDALIDQDHIDMMIISRPSVPDRTAYILDKDRENPYPHLKNIAETLADNGASIIAMPCITAHYFQSQLEQDCKVPVIDGIGETVSLIKAAGYRRIGIMATEGTINSRLFQKAIEQAGLEAIIPDDIHEKMVMELIYDYVKAGKNADMDMFGTVVSGLLNDGAEIIILGCTELSVIKKMNNIGDGFIDVIDVISRKSVLECGKLKEEYMNLLKPADKNS